MALLQIGAENGGIVNAIGNNSIAAALGISQGSISPLTFATKFGAQTLFSVSSLPYVIRTNKNFDVIFHWFPKRSQIRTYFANAFSASDVDELTLFIRSIEMPKIINNIEDRSDGGRRMGSALPGRGSGVSSRSGAFSMNILSTEFSLVDHCFYQWMRETEAPYWIYGPTTSKAEDNSTVSSVPKDFQNVLKGIMGTFNDDKKKDTLGTMTQCGGKSCVDFTDVGTSLVSCQSESEITPFTRADIEVKYYSGNQKPLHSVIFYGAFPVGIETMGVDHEKTFKESYRVDFACDSVDISSPFVAESDSWASKTTGAINEFLGEFKSNSAKWTSGLQDDILTNYANVWLAKASRMINKTTNKAGDKLSDTLKNTQKKLGV